MGTSLDVVSLIPQILADIATLKAQIQLLLWFVGLTLVPVWVSALNGLWKTFVVKKFLNGGG